jgi:hypothetical protein
MLPLDCFDGVGEGATNEGVTVSPTAAVRSLVNVTSGALADSVGDAMSRFGPQRVSVLARGGCQLLLDCGTSPTPAGLERMTGGIFLDHRLPTIFFSSSSIMEIVKVLGAIHLVEIEWKGC